MLWGLRILATIYLKMWTTEKGSGDVWVSANIGRAANSDEPRVVARSRCRGKYALFWAALSEITSMWAIFDSYLELMWRPASRISGCPCEKGNDCTEDWLITDNKIAVSYSITSIEDYCRSNSLIEWTVSGYHCRILGHLSWDERRALRAKKLYVCVASGVSHQCDENLARSAVA